MNKKKHKVEVAKINNMKTMVGHLLQYHPIFIKLREMVKNDFIGKLDYVYSNRLSFGKLRSEEDVMELCASVFR